MANVLTPRGRNALVEDRPSFNARLNQEMSHPGPNALPFVEQSIRAIKAYPGRVISGEVAKEYAADLLNTGVRLSQGETAPNMPLAVQMTPIIGDAYDISEAAKYAVKGEYGSAALSAIGVIPFVPGIAGIIAGKNAKIANTLKLSKAKQMKASKATRESIWKETGWFEGVDGKWKFEIDDSAYKYHPEKLGATEYAGKGYKTGGQSYAMTHPELSTAYPSTAEIKHVKYPWKGNSRGIYRDGVEAFDDPPTITVWDGGDTKSTNIHEIQHYLQKREGFARGGSAEMMGISPDRPISKRWELWRKHPKEVSELNALSKSSAYSDEIADSNKVWGRDYDSRLEDIPEITADFGTDEFDRQAKLASDKIDKVFADFAEHKSRNYPNINRVDDLSKILEGGNRPQKLISGSEAYKRLAGESEARAVQKRMNLTPAQRAVKPFWEDFDVPESEQIIRYGDGVSEAAGRKLVVSKGQLGKNYSNDYGRISVMEDSPWSPRPNSITDFVVKEGQRGKGVGGNLLDDVLGNYDINTISAAASSEHSVALLYKRGLRPGGDAGASLADAIKLMRESSSVTMFTPE